jgi:hypothetical protein
MKILMIIHKKLIWDSWIMMIMKVEVKVVVEKKIKKNNEN